MERCGAGPGWGRARLRAQLLFISTKTVSVHVSNVLAELQATGRTEAVAIAQRQGLLGSPVR